MPNKSQIMLSMLLITTFCFAEESILGTAGDYNVFSFGTLTLHRTDTEGKIAARGNVSIDTYSVARSSTPALYSLISAGNVTFSNGVVHNGGIYSGNNSVVRSAYIYGDVATKVDLLQQNGGTYEGNFITGNNAIVESYLTSKIIRRDPGACPVDFNIEYQKLSALSSYLSTRTPNGTVVVDNYNGLTLSGNNNINYFLLPGGNLSNASGFTLNVPADAISIINVSGNVGEVKSFAFFNSRSQNVLFNFYESRTINIHNIGFEGSILAPNADIVCENGYVNGNVIGNSISGDGEFHDYPFSYMVSNIPPDIRPFVNNIIKNLDGTYTAVFGYENSGTIYSVSAGTSDNGVNYQNITNGNFGQPSVFRAGRVNAAFSVNFNGSTLVWHVFGRNATATGNSFTLNVVNNANEDYLYRPYPNIFVHGFNSWPEGTFKLPTRKTTFGKKGDKKLKDKLFSSTLITRDLNKSDNAIPGFLTELLDPENKRPFNNNKQFKDFYKDTSLRNETRMSPYEEDSSYVLRNHSYIEAFCSNYAFESNDKDGVKYGHFARPAQVIHDTVYDTNYHPHIPLFDTIRGNYGCSENQYGCYHISPASSLPTDIGGLGGQAQLFRIRLIQLLNEYYGDWKWVNDPTAKVNIICHSNGGLLTTFALAYDSLFYNNGNSYTIPNSAVNCWASPNYNITGMGFRLADHVNQVITIDTPFDGSPFANKDGNLGDAGKMIFNTISTIITPSIYIPGVEGFLVSSLLNDLIKDKLGLALADIGYDAIVNGKDSPIMRDFGPESNFNKSMHASNFPHGSSGQTVPYFNIVGHTDLLGTLIKSAGPFFKIRAIYKMATLRFISARRDFKIASSLDNLGSWFKNSDFIVPLESQDMTCIYPGSEENRRLLNIYTSFDGHPRINPGIFFNILLEPSHMNITNGRAIDPAVKAVASDYGAGDNGYILDVPFVICKNQSDETNRDIIKRAGTVSCGSNAVPDLRHSFIRFKGMCGTPSERWLTKNTTNDYITVFRPDMNTGKPVKLVAYLHDYFMNNGNLTIKTDDGSHVVPFYDITQVPPSEGVGSWASRFVDKNGDGNIDNEDLPGGSWIFIPIDTSKIVLGDNLIEINKSLAYSSDSLSAFVNLKWGTAINVFESDTNGYPVGNRFIDQAVSWNIGAGEEKRVLCSFSPQINGNNVGTKITIRTGAGKYELMRVNTSPSAGQFHLYQKDTVWLLEFVLNPNLLSKNINNEVNVTQVMQFTLFDKDDNQSNTIISFFIDKAPPKIAVLQPALKGDFNNDGKVDLLDNCNAEIAAAPVNCSDVCNSYGITDDPSTPENECTEAIDACNSQPSSGTNNLSHTDCDGIDNDLNGYSDNNDISEMFNIKYYSPRYDSTGVCTNPVSINFQISDDPIPANKLQSVEWVVYRAAGNTAGSNDYFVYSSKNYAAEMHNNKLTVTSSWNYNPYSKTSLPPEGLYYVKVKVQNTINGCEVQRIESDPAYFIIDRTPPSMCILEDWHDEYGSTTLNPGSNTFKMVYKPGNSGRYSPRQFDSETQKVTIIFHPDSGSFSFVGPYTYESTPDYNDKVTYSQGTGYPQNNWQVPDGDIDPATFELPLDGDFSSHDSISMQNTYSNMGFVADLIIDMIKQYKLRMLKNLLIKGNYTVEYILEDKAGNISRIWDKNKIVRVKKGSDAPVLEESKMSADTKNNYNGSDGEWLVSSKGETSSPSQTSDALNFLWISVAGDFSFTIKVSEIQRTGSNTVGVMARETLNPDAVFASISLTEDGKAFTSSRSVPGADKYVSGFLPGNYNTSSTWIRMERQGSIIKEYVSSDGINFTQADQFTISKDTIYVGAYQSDFSGNYASAVFRIIPKPTTPSVPPQNQFGIISDEQTILSDRTNVIGSVGSNRYVELGFDSKIRGDVVSGRKFLMRERSRIFGNLTVGDTLIKQIVDTIDGSIVNPTLVAHMLMPVYSVPYSSINKDINYGDSLVLEPGAYGDVHALQGSKIILRTGNYYFKTLNLESDSKLRITSTGGKLDIKVANGLTIGDRCEIGDASTSPLDVSIYSNQNTLVYIGYDTYIVGCLLAPNAPVEIYTRKALNGTARFRGSIGGKTVKLDHDVIIDATGMASTYEAFPDPSKWYKIATKANPGLCLDVSGGSYTLNNTIQLWGKCNINQEFQFKNAGNGYYTITCRGNTGFSIDMSGNFANGQKLKLWTTDVNNANQKFKLVPVTGGYYRLETSNSGFSIDNWGAGGNGTKPALWTSSDSNDNQKWVISVVP